uniref:Uncharacterized protein n=1 Tax=Trichogramma kaykai TaxID=54128 RepID=A0ABD2WGG5_9HYME
MQQQQPRQCIIHKILTSTTTAAAAAAVTAAAAAATLLTPTTTSLSYSLRGSPVVLMLADNVPIVCPNVPGHIASAWTRAPAVAYVYMTIKLCRYNCTTQHRNITNEKANAAPTSYSPVMISLIVPGVRGCVQACVCVYFGSNPCEAYYIRLNYAIKVDELLLQEDSRVHRLRWSR